MKYPLLLPTIPHGITDIIDTPKLSFFSNILSFIFVKNLNLYQRKVCLILSSILHISNDFSFNIYINLSFSCIMHYIWIYKPIISKLYLSFYHTPLHYYRNIYISNNINKNIIKINLILITSIISIYLLDMDFHILTAKKYGELWWISPILSHIYMTNIHNAISL